jgi:hypothetical protein
MRTRRCRTHRVELPPAFRWEPTDRRLRLGTGRGADESDRAQDDCRIARSYIAGEAMRKGRLECEWSGTTTLTRARGGLGLIATILQVVFGMHGNPNDGQERPLIDLSRGESDQQLTDGPWRSDACVILSPCRRRAAAPAGGARSTRRRRELASRLYAIRTLLTIDPRTVARMRRSDGFCRSIGWQRSERSTTRHLYGRAHLAA